MILLGFLFVLRLQTSLISLAAFSHVVDTGVTTGIVLQAGESGTKDTLAALNHHKCLIGNPLLLPTILVDICLARSIERSLETKRTLDFIEDETQQHTWAEFVTSSYDTNLNNLTFEELMRHAHGSKIEVAVAQRKARVAWELVSFLRQTYTEIRPSGDFVREDRDIRDWIVINDWINYLNSLAQMEATDADFLMKRAENQISAVKLPAETQTDCSTDYGGAHRSIASHPNKRVWRAGKWQRQRKGTAPR
jgi:hypothetical protein